MSDEQEHHHNYNLSNFQAKIESKQAPPKVLILCQHKAQRVGETHAMAQAKKKSHEIINAHRTGRKFLLKQVAECCYNNCDGNQEFNPVRRKADDIEYA